MRLQRLTPAHWPAVLDRMRQEFQRRIDRIVLSAGARAATLVPHAHLFPSPRRLRSMSRGLQSGRVAENGWPGPVAREFFAGGSMDATLRVLHSKEPESCRRIIAAADRICAGEFDLLGYRGLFFGNPPDWHLDPVSGHRAPQVHWSRIDALDPQAVGDSKVIWELNRHQWMVTLGQAYRLRDDKRYAEAFVRLLRDWMSHNPPGIGINWASSLEVSLRLVAWSWALCLFEPSSALTSAFFEEALGWIRSHALHVFRYLSSFYSPNTHLTGEALGLYYAGVLFPKLTGANRWRSRGRRILLRELDRQVLDDGVFFELSSCYQRYTAEFYLHFLLLSKYDGKPLPERVAERLKALLDWLLAVRCPDGTVPQIGDADSGCLLPLAGRNADDYRGLFALAAALFGRSDYAWAAAGEGAEVAWLLGTGRYETFRRLARRPPDGNASRCFPKGGFVVMRNAWRHDAHHLIFDTGALGCPLSSGHGHADLLGIQCASFGRPQIVDPGTGCYTSEQRWRNHFRSTGAHSTVIVDGQDQALPKGPFSWNSRPVARLRCFTSAQNFDYADADHDAYAHLPGHVTHRRRVLFVKPSYWVVIDDIRGTGSHEVELNFQFADEPLTVSRKGWVRSGADGTPGLFIRAVAGRRLAREVCCGRDIPTAGWISPQYGQRRSAPLLRWSTTTPLPLRIISLMVPTTCGIHEIPDLAVKFTAAGVTSVVSATENITIDTYDVSIEHRDKRTPRPGRSRVNREEGTCVELPAS